MRRIYVLQDPRDHEIRYVGVTKATLQHRLYGHISGARRGRDKTYRANWVRQLLRAGYTPLIELVQEIDDDHWPQAEKYWISHFRTIGCKLTNSSEGGEGQAKSYGRTSESQRRTFDADTRALLSRINTGKTLSLETRKKISEAKKASGWKPSPEHLAALSAATKGKSRSPEASAKMVATRRANNPEWFPTGFVRVKGARRD